MRPFVSAARPSHPRDAVLDRKARAHPCKAFGPSWAGARPTHARHGVLRGQARALPMQGMGSFVARRAPYPPKAFGPSWAGARPTHARHGVLDRRRAPYPCKACGPSSQGARPTHARHAVLGRKARVLPMQGMGSFVASRALHPRFGKGCARPRRAPPSRARTHAPRRTPPAAHGCNASPRFALGEAEPRSGGRSRQARDHSG